MKKGAFAIIDCLGFKGIWKREGVDPVKLINRLISLEDKFRKHLDLDIGIVKDLPSDYVQSNVQLISDSIAISLTFDTDIQDRNRISSVDRLCRIVIRVLNYFLYEDPPLVIRGCISFGEHVSTKQFFVGPAVDEAAEQERLAQGAFVWLLPSAAREFENYFVSTVPSEENNEETRNIFYAPLLGTSYRMPIKGGGYFDCPIVNPLAGYSSADMRRDAINRYSRAMEGDRLDIWIKKQNTKEMLHAANIHSERSKPWNAFVL